MPSEDIIPVSGSQNLGAFGIIQPDQVGPDGGAGATNGKSAEIEKVAAVGPNGEWLAPLSEATGQSILKELRIHSRMLAKIANEFFAPSALES